MGDEPTHIVNAIEPGDMYTFSEVKPGSGIELVLLYFQDKDTYLISANTEDLEGRKFVINGQEAYASHWKELKV